MGVHGVCLVDISNLSSLSQSILENCFQIAIKSYAAVEVWLSMLNVNQHPV